MRIIDEDSVKYHGLNGKSEEYKEGYFDAMSAHDNAPTVINNIVILRPKTDDVIVVSYNMMSIDCKTMANIYEMIKESFPNNKVLCIPDKISMEYCDERVLNEYIRATEDAISHHRN